MRRESTVYTIVFTFLIAFAFVFLLSLANEVTREQIVLNQELARQAAVLNAFGIPYEGPARIPEVYNENVEVVQRADVELFRATVDGQTAFARLFSRNALWGTVTGVVAVNSEVSRTIGLEIIAHNETPGLGGRIDEDWFKRQFRGERIQDNEITVDIRSTGTGDYEPDNATVDAISGATLTSLYMQDIINAEIEVLRNALEGSV